MQNCGNKFKALKKQIYNEKLISSESLKFPKRK